MPSLETYKADLDYSYAPGFFPAMECLLHRPELVRRILIHSRARDTEVAEKLQELAASRHVRVEEADRALLRISSKENCYAAAVFTKEESVLKTDTPHIVLHCPSDSGNVGTILRTALGFGIEDIALIRPCVDVFDPHTVRASMGSLFQLRVHTYKDFQEYLTNSSSGRSIYPFMLDGSCSLETVVNERIQKPWTLVFGNEGSGLPHEFSTVGQPVRIPSNDRVDSLNLSVAAAIAIYAFTQNTK